MLIAPYLPGGLTIDLTTVLVSRPYVALTAEVMASFGVSAVTIGDRRITVGAGRYVAADYYIEVDASSASYAFAAAAIVGGTVVVDGLGTGSHQGDAGFARVLASMGASVTTTRADTTISVDGPLHGIDIDMSDISDTVPSLAVVAAFAGSETTIRGVEFIRRKETDRVAALVTELRRCGADVDEHPDGLTIRPAALNGASIETYHDHRIAMAMALVGLRVQGIVINDPGVVSKSWPNYWRFLTAFEPGAPRSRSSVRRSYGDHS
jgi:3-phosphoshikimate 1-carboxyvinyltransferase